VPKFDQQKLRYLLVKMFIGLELPFTKVEHQDFQEFVTNLNPSSILYLALHLQMILCCYGM
jgi:hypothetical protein